MTYHSEHGQDRWLEENIFCGKRNGIFVELGALDGIYTSNTLFFERERDWNGLLIEANPVMFCRLMQSARRARIILAAVATDPGIAVFAVPAVAGWGGILSDMDRRHLDRVENTGGLTSCFHVATLPLGVILEQCWRTRIDYLSLDVEGAELAVLHGIDFDRCDIDVLDIENNYGGHEVEEFMRVKGYRKIHTIAINDIYRRSL